MYRQFKESEIEDAKSKIDHIVNKEKIQKSLKVAPSGTESLLSGVNVFSKDQQKVKPEDFAPPFICHKDIKLSKNELKVLSRGPKFMVREEIDEELFEVEMEKMIAHQVFQSCVITRDCDMVVTYQKNSTGQFRFQLGGIIKSGVEYVALGISEINKMPGASVMACSR